MLSAPPQPNSDRPARFLGGLGNCAGRHPHRRGISLVQPRRPSLCTDRAAVRPGGRLAAVSARNGTGAGGCGDQRETRAEAQGPGPRARARGEEEGQPRAEGLGLRANAGDLSVTAATLTPSPSPGGEPEGSAGHPPSALSHLPTRNQEPRTKNPSPPQPSTLNPQPLPPTPSSAITLLIGLLAFAVAAITGWKQKDLPPAYHDEYSYLFQTHTLLAGRTWFPSFEGMPQVFDQMHVLNEGRFASRYFPGAGMWFMAFHAVGPIWGQWFAQAVTAIGASLVATQIAGRRPGCGPGWLWHFARGWCCSASSIWLTTRLWWG